MLSEDLLVRLKEGESERLAFRLFFGHEAIETLVAFANSQGGVLLLGVSELKEIKGVPDAKENIKHWNHEIQTTTTPRLSPYIEIIEIDRKSVVWISIAEYPVKPVAFEGKYYRRVNKFNQELSIQDAIDFRQQLMDTYWDSNPRSDKTVANLSFRKLHRQIRRISRKKRSFSEEPLTFLRKYSLTEGDAITNACWLLFSPDEMPETTIELGRFSSPTVTTDTLTLKSDLFTEAEEAMRFICKHIANESHPNESVQWQYPLEAIRELVVNMIIHRDYTSDYNSIIKIFDGYMEFYNSGALPDDLSIKQILSEEYISRPRNRQIAELFKDAGMFGEYGSGIQQIRTSFINKGLRPPEFIKLPGRLIVRVFGDTSSRWKKETQDTVNAMDIVDSPLIRTPEIEPAAETEPISELKIKSEIEPTSNSNPDLNTEQIPVIEYTNDRDLDFQKEDEENNHDDNDNFSDREQQIIAYILEDNRIPLNDIAEKLNVSKRTILRDIKKMKRGKVLERVGSEKNGYWEINATSLS